MAPVLELRDISKGYADGRGVRTEVLKSINLSVDSGEFVAILGFSGTGKTTLISLMAGLIQADAGEVVVNGKPSSGPGSDRGLVFQSYSLMPWLSVAANVRLAVDAVHKSLSRPERERLVRDTVDLVGLSHAIDRKPSELSGGMRQRVAVARALAMKPDILLLDEPLSALDALTRAKLQAEIERIRAQERKTIILITNDVDEALLLADRVVILEPGGTLGETFPIDLQRPRNRTELNHDVGYQQLRNRITACLGKLNKARAETAAHDTGILPKVQPISLLSPPKAYRDAARTRLEQRYLEFFNVTKIYPTPKGPLTVVDGFNLLMDKGEFISLIGHSGCGKSTVLSMTAGLTGISRGGIVLDGREIASAGPDRAVVFQAPSLMPWLTARQNVAAGVDRVYPHASRAERRDIVDYYLSRVGLGDSLDKLAADMSNGMRQRVGIARAFALSPKLLLLDEPFGMLDSVTRWDLQDVLMEVWERTHVTAVCVTHDVDEAILLADRVVMMTNGPNARIGEILQVDLPRPRDRKALLDHPKFYEYRQKVLRFLEEYEHGAKAEVA